MGHKGQTTGLAIAAAWTCGDWDWLAKIPAGKAGLSADNDRAMQLLVNAASVSGDVAALARRVSEAEDAGLADADIVAAILSGIELRLLRGQVIRGDLDGLSDKVASALARLLPDGVPNALVDQRLVQIMMAEGARPEAAHAARALTRDVSTATATVAGFDMVHATVSSREAIGPALAAFPVNDPDGNGGFALAAHGGRLFCAYWNPERALVLAARGRKRRWREVILDQKISWDSHDLLALACDAEGHLHLCGNMHAAPLVYYRSTRPGDIESMERVSTMTGLREGRMTYPRFLGLPCGNLAFVYRDGSSGNGVTVINRHDAATGKWTQPASAGIIDGEGIRSAYLHGPVIGPAGDFHVTFVWRDTPDAETCHRLCHAVSDDLISWRTGRGSWSNSPLTFGNVEVVDDVPPGGGLINNNHPLGFDSLGRVLVAYHKFDPQGFTQLYIARREAAGWLVRQITGWRDRWDFAGRGSLDFTIRLMPPMAAGPGKVVQEYWRQDCGRISILLDEDELVPLGETAGSHLLPAALTEAEPGLRANIAFDPHLAMRQSVFPLLLWQSRPENRDLPVKGGEYGGDELVSTLELVQVRRGRVAADGGASLRHITPGSDVPALDLALGCAVNRGSHLRALGLLKSRSK
jgi:hypothetical protein